jgi:hypothetical protein
VVVSILVQGYRDLDVRASRTVGLIHDHHKKRAPMTELNPAGIMAEHQPWVTGASGQRYCGNDSHGESTAWPCLPYLLAEQMVEARRAAAEQAWNECVAYFAILGPLNGHDRIKGYVLANAQEDNPYASWASSGGADE